MSATVVWPWQRRHRRVMDALREDVDEARKGRRAAELRREAAKAQRAASDRVVSRAEAAAKAKSEVIAANHFTELLRQSMGRRS